MCAAAGSRARIRRPRSRRSRSRAEQWAKRGAAAEFLDKADDRPPSRHGPVSRRLARPARRRDPAARLCARPRQRGARRPAPRSMGRARVTELDAQRRALDRDDRARARAVTAEQGRRLHQRLHRRSRAAAAPDRDRAELVPDRDRAALRQHPQIDPARGPGLVRHAQAAALFPPRPRRPLHHGRARPVPRAARAPPTGRISSASSARCSRSSRARRSSTAGAAGWR